MIEIDEFDEKILKIVQQNNRIPAEKIAEEVGLSASAVQRRLRHLRKDGIIQADVSIVSPAAGGQKITAVVFVGSTSAPGYKLIDNAQYPNIAEDFERTFRLLKNLQCDVFLGSHGRFFGLQEKIAQLAKNPKQNPFIDSEAYGNYLRQSEENFREQLKKQQQVQKKN